jgi:hypothetical protein
MSFLPDEQSSRQRFSSFPAIWELGLAVRKKTPRDGDLLQAAVRAAHLDPALDLPETRLIGEVVGSLPVGIIHLKTTTVSECKTLKVRWLLTFFGITLMQGERVEHDYNS